ncbi:class I adenylate-forming enzyme family protein [Nakamurella sp. PAMC28650]|uniref:class I adenylate-forming enzyme family protein n=1 Tax=Nakamurella sp. PAMC28650 TaxID=2762325 RepID=UPI00164E068A|nr:class I adenylate-forming enzyme family protein [Nakamurella sp. PAMC28650]QNK82208.1 acyl--CoA ligase [Nakamurella sp. PAMC28650]
MTRPTGLSPQHRAALGRATLGDQLRRHGANQPDKVAFVVANADGSRRSISYSDLDRMANRAARMLLGLGVSRGDRVAVLSRNRIETVATYYGALKIGAVFTGVNPLFGPAEIRQQLLHAEPGVLCTSGEFVSTVTKAAAGLQLHRVSFDGPASDETSEGDETSGGTGWSGFAELTAAVPDTDPESAVDELDVAMLVYTSGTEATPKGVLIQHRNYLISTAPAWSWGLRTGPDDVWLFVMPFHTIAGLGSMTTLTMMGATLVLPATTDPAGSLAIIRDEKVTVIAQTPTFYLALAGHPGFGAATVGSVVRCMTYGGQVSPHAVGAWAAAAPDVVWGTYWGQSELSQLGSVGWFRTLADIPDQDATWIGKPVTHLEIQVVGDDGQPAEIGELLCRSPSAMLGYYKDPERTERVFAGGWVHTGDMVRRDREGNLFFYDRVKDMVKTGGLNVSSQEVERVLHQHPDVLRAAVVGLPDEYWSEAVTAFVIAQPGTDVQAMDLIAFCREHLAAYKAPKAVHLVDEFPVDAQGKILKRELRLVAIPGREPALARKSP